MKRILFFISLFISAVSFGQVGNFTRPSTDSSKLGATTEFLKRDAWNRQEHPLGIIYQKNSWTSTDLTNDFTQSGGITASVVSNKIQISGGANTYTQLLKINGASYLEHVTMSVKVKLGALTTSSYGFGIGWRSLNGFVDGSGNARFGIVSPATTSKVFLDAVGAPFGSTNGTVAGSANDYILLTYTKSFPYAILSARNMTTGTASVDSTFAVGGGGNTGNYTIYSFGGTFTIDSISVTSPELVNASDLFIGDSKTEGTAATDYMGRYCSLVAPYSKSLVDVGAGGDRTTEILLRMTEILSLHPKRAYMAIGSNDLRSGTSEGTFESNYSSISSQLLAAGVDVYYLLPFFETAEDQTTQKAFIVSTFPAGKIIDTWTPTNVTGRLASDGIHPNDLGHQAIANAIIQTGLFRDNKYKPVNDFGLMSRVGINVYQKINGLPTLVFTDSVGTGAGGGTPGGSTTQLQYNNAGSFGGIIGATSDGTNLYLPAFYGGTASAGNVTFHTTSHTTKGKYIFDATRGSYWSESIGNIFLGGSGASNYAYTASFSDLTGGGAIFPAMLLQNTNASSPAGGQYNIAMTNMQAGNGAVTAQFAANYGSGATAPFTVQGALFGSRSNDPVIFFQNSNQIVRIDATGANPFTTAAFDLGTSSLAWRTGYFAAGTSTIAQINIPAGTKKTTMVDGDFSHSSGHLFFHDGSTDYDLLAGGYTLPTATGSVLGGIKIGTTLGIVSGVVDLATTLASGTYTPTLTNTTNITSSSANTFYWQRTGNIVQVFGSVDVTPTSVAGCNLGVTLPVASNLVSGTDLDGNGSGPGTIYTVIGDGTNDRATLGFIASSTLINRHYFSFSYIVQ